MILNDFKDKIYKDINESNLSIDAIYYVMKDIMNDIVNAYNRQIEYENAEAASKVEQDAVKEKSDAAAAQVKEKEEK